MTFREDINLLRAAAVLAVVIFHFRPDWLPGGYAGVDVFFVISGYLITGVIIKRMNTNTFSFWGFYADRINRIFPALLALGLFLFIFGWFVFSALDYRYLGKQLVFSLTYLSNFLFTHEAGYFDRSSFEKLLLHTWSLSVEWQFYLLYPFLLRLVWHRLSRVGCAFLIGLGFLISFIIASFFDADDHSGYFLLHTRAWELLAGSLVAILATGHSAKEETNPLPLRVNTLVSDNSAKVFMLLGWGLILGSFFIVDKTLPWPGVWTLLPVGGTALVLYRETFFVGGHCSGRSDWKHLYSEKSLAGFVPKYLLWLCHMMGKSSYSIYIWHWPLAVFGSFYLLPYIRWWGIPVSLLLGYASYLFIESLPARLSVRVFRRAAVSLLMTVILVSLGLVVWRNDGLIERLDGELKTINESALNAWNEQQARVQRENDDRRFVTELFDSNTPFIDGSSDAKILFVGASHIGQMYSYVEKNSPYFDVYFLIQPGCFVVHFESRAGDPCEFLDQFKPFIQSINFDRIVVSLYCIYCKIYGSREQMEHQIDVLAKDFDDWLVLAKEHSKQVYLVTGEPFGAAMDPVVATRRHLPDYLLRREVEGHYHWQNRAFKQLKELDGIEIINPLDYLCDNEVCPARTDEGDFLYFDHSHMRPQYVRERMTYLQPILDP